MRLPSRDLEDLVSHVGEEWEKLRDARILLTGGTGFLGRWLVESFSHANASKNLQAEMSVVSRNPAAFRASAPHIAADNAIAMIRADLRNPDFGAGARSRYDVIIHAATASSAELANGGPQAIAGTVEETRRVLDLAVSARARRILYLSSGAVYGRQPPDLSHIPEDFPEGPDPSEPSSAYGMTKRAGELLCSIYAEEHPLEAVIARGFATIGPLLPLGQKFAAGAFLSDVLEGRAVQVRGDGTPIRSYLYAADLAAWLWIILLCGESGRAYNVGSEDAVSIGELAEEAASLAHKPLPVEIAGTPDPSRPANRFVPSTARARQELGLAEWLDWREALRRTYQWHREALSERSLTVAG